MESYEEQELALELDRMRWEQVGSLGGNFLRTISDHPGTPPILGFGLGFDYGTHVLPDRRILVFARIIYDDQHAILYRGWVREEPDGPVLERWTRSVEDCPAERRMKLPGSPEGMRGIRWIPPDERD